MGSDVATDVPWASIDCFVHSLPLEAAMRNGQRDALANIFVLKTALYD